MGEVDRIGDFSLQWGESVRWDDRRQRLYFVDCAARHLHWLEGAQPPLGSLPLPGLPTGLVLTEDHRLVVALDEALHVVDPDDGSVEVLTPYPEGLGGRANDATADLDGNLVTGTLNLAPGPGSYWWYSSLAGWRQLDDGIGNANGPVVVDDGEGQTLYFADTLAGTIYAYDYDGAEGSVGDRRVFARSGELGGLPDGATADTGGGVWSCLFGAGKIVRFTSEGVDRVVEAGVEIPSDVTFGGEDLDRIFFVSVALELGGVEVRSQDAGGLMVIEDSGYRGSPEARFRL
jgi:sugar lactone lactonase YvrE